MFVVKLRVCCFIVSNSSFDGKLLISISSLRRELGQLSTVPLETLGKQNPCVRLAEVFDPPACCKKNGSGKNSVGAWRNGWFTEAVGEFRRSITVAGPTERDFSLELLGDDLSEEDEEGDGAVMKPAEVAALDGAAVVTTGRVFAAWWDLAAF